MDPNRTVLTDQQIIGLVGQDIYDQTVVGARKQYKAGTGLIWGAEGLIGRGRGTGGTYFPNGFVNDKNNPDAQTIFFPASGNRSQSGGGMNDGGSGFYWSSSPRSATNGYSLLFGSGDVTPSYVNSHRASGFPVRCVKE